MGIDYWVDEVIRLVQEKGYSIRSACFKVKCKKRDYEQSIKNNFTK